MQQELRKNRKRQRSKKDSDKLEQLKMKLREESANKMKKMSVKD